MVIFGGTNPSNVRPAQTRPIARVVSRVGRGTANGAHELKQIGKDDLEEGQADADQEGNGSKKGKASVAAVHHALTDKLAHVNAKNEADAEADGGADKECRSAKNRAAQRLGTVIGGVPFKDLLLFFHDHTRGTLIQPRRSEIGARHTRR